MLNGYIVLLARLFFIAWVFPFFVMYSVYFGFISAMNMNFFTYSVHTDVYSSGVFLYRIIPTYLLDTAYTLIDTYNLPARAPEALYKLWPEADEKLFSAFFYVNFLTLCALLSIVFLIVENLVDTSTSIVTEITVLCVLGLFAFTQNVVVPYDALSYVCLAVAIYATAIRPFGLNPLWLVIPALIVGGLTRETAALILSFYAGWHWRHLFLFSELRSGLRSPLGQLILLVAIYCLLYVTLRTLIPSDRMFFTGIRFADNKVHQFSQFGWMFLASGMAGFCLLRAARIECIVFVIFSMPYVIMISLISNPREYRLFIPIFLIMILMQLIKGLRSTDHKADSISRSKSDV